MSFTRLYNIEPIGIGTPYVESLPSYLKRLAEAHSVSIVTLLMHEVFSEIQYPYRHKMDILNYGDNKKPLSLSFINEVVRILEEKTSNQNIRNTTVSKYGYDIFSKLNFRKYTAWCPECYEESKQSRQPIYEPLLWCFEDIKICRKHNVNLIDVCPNCGYPIKRICTTVQHGHCYICHSWLGSSNFVETSRVENQDIMVYNRISNMLSDIPNINVFSMVDFESRVELT